MFAASPCRLSFQAAEPPLSSKFALNALAHLLHETWVLICLTAPA